MKRPNITPGPWRRDRAGVNVIDPKEKSEYVLCHCHESRLPVIEANAQAIATLPDLLDALERALSLLECANDHQRKAGRLEYDTQTARAALTKAGYTF